MWIFEPILKRTIWGGSNIAALKQNMYNCTGISDTTDNIGESWEISAVEGSVSVVAEGPQKGFSLTQLMEKYRAELSGKKNFELFGTRFPILIKFIDASKDLSIQVHPDNEMAARLHETMGKTEMWYVVDAKNDARICCGFKREINPTEYDSMIHDGSIKSVLNFHNIHKGEAYYIPSGRIHTIGAGSFLAEIQQTSDITYRVYDYHRKDSDGKLRKLHTDLAHQAINFADTDGKPIPYDTQTLNRPVELIETPFFNADLITVTNEMHIDYASLDSFVILIITEGDCIISHDGELQPNNDTTPTNKRRVNAGTTILLPATTKNVNIHPLEKTIILQTFVK